MSQSKETSIGDNGEREQGLLLRNWSERLSVRLQKEIGRYISFLLVGQNTHDSGCYSGFTAALFSFTAGLYTHKQGPLRKFNPLTIVFN